MLLLVTTTAIVHRGIRLHPLRRFKLVSAIRRELTRVVIVSVVLLGLHFGEAPCSVRWPLYINYRQLPKAKLRKPFGQLGKIVHKYALRDLTSCVFGVY